MEFSSKKSKYSPNYKVYINYDFNFPEDMKSYIFNLDYYNYGLLYADSLVRNKKEIEVTVKDFNAFSKEEILKCFKIPRKYISSIESIKY